MAQQFEIAVAGDSAINVAFGRSISAEASMLVSAAAEALESNPVKGITELVPTFCSLMVCYDPLVIRFDELCDAVKTRLQNLTGTFSSVKRTYEIPVCYGGEHGPDIQTVADNAGISIEEVIKIHSAHDYRIDMLGFLPGFAYLGGLDPRIHTPRLATPRTCIPAGSVGIGGAQTGIYPLASPGGWQIIGNSPARPYDPNRETPILYSAGDYLRFVPISESEFHNIESQVQAGTYEYIVHHEESEG